MMITRVVLILGVLWSTALSSLPAQETRRFRVDDPLWEDPDRLPVPMVEALKRSEIFDFAEGTFNAEPKAGEVVPPSQNVNTLGEVPDSSWFTNRIGFRAMTLEELTRGPNQRERAGTDPPFTIIGVKTQGVTPGFTIRDAAGEVFFVKFDTPGFPQLATSAEVIATKFFYAFGYSVPENYLGFVRRENLEISPDALLTDDEGKVRPISAADIDQIFQRVHRLPDGSTPIVASRRIPGRPVGPFKYYGVRRDDPNDIIPHQNRRELRGMRLFAAWMHHDDSRAINTLDFYQGDPGQGFVTHYLIDFGSCLGSGSIKLQSRRGGNEYIIEWGPILKAAVTLGIWDRPWRRIRYPDYPQVGRIEGDYFKPELWRPEYPNPAFRRMLPEDAAWAARIIAEFSDEMVRAIVRTGEFTDPEAEEYLIETLIKRRDKIIQHYLPQLCSLDSFEVVAGVGGRKQLSFRDLGEEHGLYLTANYDYEWFRLDNRTGDATPLAEAGTVKTGEIPIAEAPSDFLMCRIKVRNKLEAASHQIEAYLRKSGETFSVVGLDRR